LIASGLSGLAGALVAGVGFGALAGGAAAKAAWVSANTATSARRGELRI
jgi:hypothetical protein